MLAAVDGDARLVELPIGATEDRVVGSLDLQKVLRDGEHAFSPGLLARAHGGVLYVDEVNLLHDHLVDVLLDAAAMGRVHVERDGVSHSHEARFVLIGTMNPEEGELRPQLLDRFGLTVDVHASRDVDVRVEVIRQRMAFEADPDALRRAICRGGRRAGAPDRRGARLGRRLWCCRTTSYAASRRCARRSTSTGCGPIWWWPAPPSRTRPGVAQHDSRREEDIRVAAELALPHRRRRDPFDDPGLDPDQLDEALAQAGESADAPEPDPEPDPPGGGESDDGTLKVRLPATQLRRAQPGRARRRRRCSGPGRSWCPASGRARPAGGRGPATAPGTAVSATDDPRRGSRRARVRHTAGRRRSAAAAGRPRPQPDDVRRAIREGREGNLVIFVVDASGSMAARDRMSAVSGATLSLLRDAYQRRDKVAVITFRQQRRPAVAAADIVGAHRQPTAGAVRHRRENAAGARPAGRPRCGGA